MKLSDLPFSEFIKDGAYYSPSKRVEDYIVDELCEDNRCTCSFYNNWILHNYERISIYRQIELLKLAGFL